MIKPRYFALCYSTLSNAICPFDCLWNWYFNKLYNLLMYQIIALNLSSCGWFVVYILLRASNCAQEILRFRGMKFILPAWKLQWSVYYDSFTAIATRNHIWIGGMMPDVLCNYEFIRNFTTLYEMLFCYGVGAGAGLNFINSAPGVISIPYYWSSFLLYTEVMAEE